MEGQLTHVDAEGAARMVDVSGKDVTVRSAVAAGTSAGFELSRGDLEQRREGDVLGKNQSGYRSSLQNLRVLRDETTIREAREAAVVLLDADFELRQAPELAAAVEDMERSVQSDYLEKS